MSSSPVVQGTNEGGPCKETEVPLPNDSHNVTSSAIPPPSGTPHQQDLTTVTTLVISNLNDTVALNDIYELCKSIGPIEHADIVAPGVAEVTYRNKNHALEAYKRFNQKNLDGMPMVCRLQSGGNE